MSGVIKARYENKVLKPLGEIELKDGEEVEIKVRASATSKIFGIIKCWEGPEEAHEESFNYAFSCPSAPFNALAYQISSSNSRLAWPC
ncbi:MAG: antitoxin family protein [Methanothrix sp.]